MMGRDKILSMAHSILQRAEGDAVEIKITNRSHALTRFARSVIHQSVSDQDITLTVRIAVGNRMGQAECNAVTDHAVTAVINHATHTARQTPSNSGPVLMAARQQYGKLPTFIDQIQSFTAVARAQAVTDITRTAARINGETAGAISTQLTEEAIVNTQGAQAYQTTSEADALTVLTANNQSGYARQVTPDPTTFDFTALAEEAASKCSYQTSPIRLDPGQYTVVLEPYAVGDMIMVLSLMGCGADAVQQDRSFMCSRIGEQVADQCITIYDDALDPRSLPAAFDQEAVAKQRTVLIDQGTVCGPVYDLATAARADKQSTGHAGLHGPTASHLFMAPGTSSVDQMIADIEYGILVTRFHYIAVVNAAQTAWSGMTRDGTLLIEQGRISRPIVNMRFSDQILSMLSQIRAVSSEQKLTRGYVGSAYVPALAIDNFTFTGATL